MTQGPVLIELDADDNAVPGPDQAPPVPEVGLPVPEGRAMQAAATWAARGPSRLAQWFWGLLLAVLGAILSVAVWDFATGLIARVPVLGYAVTALLAALALVALIMIVRELAAFSSLSRMDKLHTRAQEALAEDSLPKARDAVARLEALYAKRPELEWNRARFAERRDEQFDAAGLLGLAEAEMLTPLDAAARAEVEAAARQVAMVTALVPLAMADVIAALTSNLRMIRRVAEVYGGRSGTLGSWRLTRAVMTHLLGTGAVAIGDDMIGSLAGGNVLAKLSRRFGEGMVNGALTARVGLAAMEVCRPLPFSEGKKPSVTGTVRRALTGLFGLAG